MDYIEFIRVFGFTLILIYLIFGVDDTIWFLLSMILSRKKDKNGENASLDFKKLRNTPPKMLAISIAAWHEANVIGDVIRNFINTTDYPKSMYHLFVGVYPNDPDTIMAVRELGKTYPNVHAIVNCKEGPTTKAQNINHVIRQIKLFEEEHQIQFASLTIHDSEDVIHSYELLATNYLIDEKDALQFPVFPIMEMPRFRNFFRQITTATYADEFAENHFISMVERRDMEAFVPCAGTGFAISRRRLDEFGEEDVLPSESLTEDYLLSLNLYKKGIHLYYVLNKLPRVMKNKKVRNDYITTRSLFPNTFKAAIRQKTRWTYGITMQSISIKDVFMTKDISFVGRYSFYKDLKAKFLNLLPFLGYIASIYCLLVPILGLEPFYRPGSVVYYMAMVVFAMMIIRQVFRGYALYNVYGFRSVFFGCLLPPLFPIRLIYGNIINFVATVRAFKMKLFGDKKANKKVKKENKQKVKKEKKVSWSKTDHEFLSKNQLRAYRRMLGDVLITQNYISVEQFNRALEEVDKENGEQIGEYLIKQGLLSEEQMIRALGHVKHRIFIPKEVLKTIEYEKLWAEYPGEELIEQKILPLTVENDTLIIGICKDTKEEHVEALRGKKDGKIVVMYVLSDVLEEAFLNMEKKNSDHVYAPIQQYKEGSISFEQAVLIGMYADIEQKSPQEVWRYMGLLQSTPHK
ncbi:MAG: phage adsorption protein NrfB [Lachnospiraceae bacterium]|nr:phage adsorption protein NrfB [Lachnospiraceae bacterium]